MEIIMWFKKEKKKTQQHGDKNLRNRNIDTHTHTGRDSGNQRMCYLYLITTLLTEYTRKM